MASETLGIELRSRLSPLKMGVTDVSPFPMEIMKPSASSVPRVHWTLDNPEIPGPKNPQVSYTKYLHRACVYLPLDFTVSQLFAVSNIR